jgi:hypothetical protein
MIYNFQTDSILGSYSIPGIYFSPLNMFTWMKEERDKTSSGGAYLRCPVSTSVHFSLRNATRVLQSTYECVKGERA